MAQYRIYQFDMKGHVTTVRSVDCPSDREAAKAAIRFETDDASLEVRLGGRCINRYIGQNVAARHGQIELARDLEQVIRSPSNAPGEGRRAEAKRDADV